MNSNRLEEWKRIMKLFQGATILNMFHYECGYPISKICYAIQQNDHIHYIVYDQNDYDGHSYSEITDKQFDALLQETNETLAEMSLSDRNNSWYKTSMRGVVYHAN